VVHLVAGVSADRWQSVLVGALVLGLLNAFLRPVLILLTLPVNIVTLGLFTLVVNGLIFFLAARLVSGLHVAGFGTALLAAIVFSIVSFLLNMLVGSKD
jgi:putative membrane protein